MTEPFIKVQKNQLTQLIQEKRLTHAELGVLTILALHINGNGECYPSIPYLTALANLICELLYHPV